MRIKSEIKVDGDDVLTTDENTYMLYNTIEENLRRSDSVGYSSAVVPCFYKLLDEKQAVNDAPKLDGLVNTHTHIYILMYNIKTLVIELFNLSITCTMSCF